MVGRYEPRREDHKFDPRLGIFFSVQMKQNLISQLDDTGTPYKLPRFSLDLHAIVEEFRLGKLF